MVRYVRNSGIEAAPMLEETILYSPAAKRFCVLNPTAAYVWERLAEPRSPDVLAAGLREQFDTAGGVDIEAELDTALRQFEALELITRLSDV